jgi:hypothetical protein
MWWLRGVVVAACGDAPSAGTAGMVLAALAGKQLLS